MNNKEKALSDYILHVDEGAEYLIPRYGLSLDFNRFDLDSLVRMYGRTEVDEFLRGRGLRIRTA